MTATIAVHETKARPRIAPGAAVPSWAAVAAWGAGLLQLALGAGLLTSAGGDAARGAGAALVLLGAGGLGWGAATLARGRTAVPRAGIVGALVGLVAVTAGLALDPARTSVLAVVAASALLVSVALACAGAVRRGVKRGATDAEASRPKLWVLFVAAVVVAAVVTPALGATEAGRLAPGHGEHSVVDPGHH